MAGRNRRAGNPESSNANAPDSDSIERRFNQLMQAFVCSQEAQTQNQTKQREDQAVFQTQMMEVL